jgi:hypothetical protein
MLLLCGISLNLALIGYNCIFPIIQVTGGGGYTKENVARCWAVETGVLLDTELPNGISFIHFQLLRPCLVHEKFCKICHIPSHIESCDTYMEH